MTRIKTDKSEKNTSFHFPHRLWDKDSLFDEKSNSPDSSGDVSVYLFVFLALSQSPHARDKRGRKKRVPIMREKSKSNRVGHQRCRPSAVKVGAGSGPRGCERQAAVGISWSRSVIAAAGLPPPATHGPPGRSVYGTHPSFWLWAHSCYHCLLCLKKVIYKSRLRRHYAD